MMRSAAEVDPGWRDEGHAKTQIFTEQLPSSQAARELEATSSVDSDGLTSVIVNGPTNCGFRHQLHPKLQHVTAEAPAESRSPPRAGQSESDIFSAGSVASHMPPTTGPARHAQPAAGNLASAAAQDVSKAVRSDYTESKVTCLQHRMQQLHKQLPVAGCRVEECLNLQQMPSSLQDQIQLSSATSERQQPGSSQPTSAAEKPPRPCSQRQLHQQLLGRQQLSSQRQPPATSSHKPPASDAAVSAASYEAAAGQPQATCRS